MELTTAGDIPALPPVKKLDSSVSWGQAAVHGHVRPSLFERSSLILSTVQSLSLLLVFPTSLMTTINGPSMNTPLARFALRGAGSEGEVTRFHGPFSPFPLLAWVQDGAGHPNRLVCLARRGATPSLLLRMDYRGRRLVTELSTAL